MSLFQQSVLKKYISDLNKPQLQSAWQLFSGHFLNPVKQANIRHLKEEEYQEGFVRDLFVSVLGYTLNPQPDYNFVLEKKSVTDATKSDAAILLNNEVIAVAEFKDTGTPDLDKVSNQAFGYKHKHKNCNYVITSNFEKLRFYINDSTEYEEFNLFTLTQDKFAVLYLCLQKQNLLSNIPLQIKQQSLVQEQNVTKELYSHYSLFKRKLFQNIKDQNPQHDKLLLFKKTQKLLDRFLFIFFAEDRLLLPPNSVREILAQWEQLKELDNYVPLYSRFKKYFGYLNVGHTGKHYEIFTYNGGLFFPDEILDNIIIDDTILYEGAKTLSGYDFETDVDVNILGHIFEHSLTEIEELQSELEGKVIDKNKTKRKKEGVFYTPRYITKYIVENTVGALCTQKKEDLQINEETFAPQKRKAGRKALLDKIELYREWLLQLTICDPACGSGAFLNAALEYLIAEHRTADELKARIFSDTIVYTEMENRILENNLFGVDINEDAIEIAKLSLWLRTAKKGRKLSNLTNNIKCGNSLIDDASVAGDKAFKWKEEFKSVFDNEGFDVVIGNPPYGADLDIQVQLYLNKRYIQGGSETAISFVKLSQEILKNAGRLGFIIPKSFSFSSNYSPIRKYILNEISEIVDCKKVWKEVKLEQVMIFFQKGMLLSHYLSCKLQLTAIKQIGKIDKKFVDLFGFYLNDISNEELRIGVKLNSLEFFLSDIGKNQRGGNFQNDLGDNGEIKVIGGAEIQRNGISGIKGRITKSIIESNPQNFVFNNSVLVQNLVAHIENPTDHIKIIACVPDDLNYAIVDTINQITLNSSYSNKVIAHILNSTLINWYAYRFIFGRAIRTMHFDSPITARIPIPKTLLNLQQPFIDKADIMLSKNKELNQSLQQFTQLLQVKFPTININNKLQNWAKLTSTEFLKELEKQKIKLTLSQQQEWLQYFKDQKIKATSIQEVIAQTDKEIDKMVYALYGLSEEEIAVAEGNG